MFVTKGNRLSVAATSEPRVEINCILGSSLILICHVYILVVEVKHARTDHLIPHCCFRE